MVVLRTKTTFGIVESVDENDDGHTETHLPSYYDMKSGCTSWRWRGCLHRESGYAFIGDSGWQTWRIYGKRLEGRMLLWM